MDKIYSNVKTFVAKGKYVQMAIVMLKRGW